MKKLILVFCFLPTLLFARDPNVFSGFFISPAIGVNYLQFNQAKFTGSSTIVGSNNASIIINKPESLSAFISGKLQLTTGYQFKFSQHFGINTNFTFATSETDKKTLSTTAQTSYGNSGVEKLTQHATIKLEPYAYSFAIEPGFIYKKFNTINLILAYNWQAVNYVTSSSYGPNGTDFSTAAIDKTFLDAGFETGIDYYYNLGPFWELNVKLLHVFTSKVRNFTQTTTATQNGTNYTVVDNFTVKHDADNTLMVGLTYNFH